jgi:hypothetical protein
VIILITNCEENRHKTMYIVKMCLWWEKRTKSIIHWFCCLWKTLFRLLDLRLETLTTVIVNKVGKEKMSLMFLLKPLYIYLSPKPPFITITFSLIYIVNKSSCSFFSIHLGLSSSSLRSLRTSELPFLGVTLDPLSWEHQRIFSASFRLRFVGVES